MALGLVTTGSWLGLLGGCLDLVKEDSEGGGAPEAAKPSAQLAIQIPGGYDMTPARFLTAKWHKPVTEGSPRYSEAS